MALGPSSWPLIDLAVNTPHTDRNVVGKPPKAELGQVRSGRGFVLTSAQGTGRSGPCMVPLGLPGFVLGSLWPSIATRHLVGPGGALRAAVKSPTLRLPAHHVRKSQFLWG